MSNKADICLLLIDDREDALEEWCEWLTDFGYANLTTATSAKQAQALLEQQPYEIIIADMRMEASDSGFAILDYVTQRKINAVVIIVTANDSPKDCRRAFRSGAWDYMSKNTDNIFNELNESIEDAMTYLNEWGNIKDEKWVKDNWETLLTDYPNKHIAVLNYSVIAHADSSEELDDELKAKRLPLFLPYSVHVKYQASISELIQQEETHLLEFKERYQTNSDGTPNKNLRFATLKTIAAFLNSGDGTLILGIKDRSAQVTGIEADIQNATKLGDFDGFKQTVLNAVEDYIGNAYNQLVHFRPPETIDGKAMVAIDVKKAKEIVFCREEGSHRLYIRADGKTKQITDAKEIHKLILERWQEHTAELISVLDKNLA